MTTLIFTQVADSVSKHLCVVVCVCVCMCVCVFVCVCVYVCVCTCIPVNPQVTFFFFQPELGDDTANRNDVQRRFVLPESDLLSPRAETVNPITPMKNESSHSVLQEHKITTTKQQPKETKRSFQMTRPLFGATAQGSLITREPVAGSSMDFSTDAVDDPPSKKRMVVLDSTDDESDDQLSDMIDLGLIPMATPPSRHNNLASTQPITPQTAVPKSK